MDFGLLLIWAFCVFVGSLVGLHLLRVVRRRL